MCDLFALCAAHSHCAATSSPIRRPGAAERPRLGHRFLPPEPPGGGKIRRKSLPGGAAARSFQRLARVVASPIILAHIRYRSSGQVDECHAHPFALDFWGQPWIFAHNGEAGASSLPEPPSPSLAASSDSARTFEFLRDYFADAAHRRLHTPFLQILKEALIGLIERYPGEYNFLLSNGAFLWAFTNHRQFLLLRGSQKLEDALLLTTIAEGLSPENWQKISRQEGTWGKILLIAGGDLVLAGRFCCRRQWRP